MKKISISICLVFLLTAFSLGVAYGADFDNWPVATAPPVGTLGAPSNITATAGDGQVVVSWGAVTGATGYKIAINDGTTIIYTTNATTSYTATGTITSGTKTITVTNGSELQFKVTTENLNDEDSAQYGAYSAVVSGTPAAGTTTTAAATTTTAASATTTTAAAATTTTAASATTTTAAATTTTTVPALPNCTTLKSYASKMDVDGNGEINALDAALIIRYLKEGCASQ